MATSPTKPDAEEVPEFAGVSAAGWPRGKGPSLQSSSDPPSSDPPSSDPSGDVRDNRKPSHQDALQALLAFSALHEQVRRRRALADRRAGFDGIAQEKGSPESTAPRDFEPGELFVLDEVLQLVAERAVAITGADGLAIALAENNEIVLRASAGRIKPDIGARIDRSSAFSGACFRMAQIVRCDDTELDPRVNLRTCRRLGARSMVAVPLCGRRRVIGLLEAFSAEPFGFHDSDVRNLSLLAELTLAALKPEDEDRFAESAQVAASEFEPAESGEMDSSLRLTSPQTSVEPFLTSVTTIGGLETPNRPAPASGWIQPLARPEIHKPVAAQPAEELNSPDTTPEAAVISHSHRPGVLVVLVSVVVAAMLAGGLWWKLKNTQLDSAIVRTQKTASRPNLTTGAGKPASPAESGISNSSAAATTADARPDAFPGSAESTT